MFMLKIGAFLFFTYTNVENRQIKTQPTVKSIDSLRSKFKNIWYVKNF